MVQAAFPCFKGTYLHCVKGFVCGGSPGVMRQLPSVQDRPSDSIFTRSWWSTVRQHSG